MILPPADAIRHAVAAVIAPRPGKAVETAGTLRFRIRGRAAS
ncbi:hypothetical protein ACFV1C_03515 [Streptomyces sp. NPDC059605]